MKVSSDTNNLEGMEDETFGEFNALTKLLHNLDDRGLVLSLSAFAEDLLGVLLKTFMLPSDSTSILLEGFNAPLGTFSARIKAAHSLGLVNELQFHDLELLRKVRNEFAHTWRSIDLLKPKISSLIKQMNFSRIDDHFPETPNDKLRSSIICLLLELRSTANLISKHDATAKMFGRFLITGFQGSFEDQLKSALEQLKNILHQLELPESDSRSFYIGRLKLFSDRMSVLGLPHRSSLKSEEYLSFLEEVRIVLNKYGVLDENSICETHYKLKVLNGEVAKLELAKLELEREMLSRKEVD
jgi:hypothetical protein